MAQAATRERSQRAGAKGKSDRELKLVRRFTAKPEQVFRAFADPKRREVVGAERSHHSGLRDGCEARRSLADHDALLGWRHDRQRGLSRDRSALPAGLHLGLARRRQARPRDRGHHRIEAARGRHRADPDARDLRQRAVPQCASAGLVLQLRLLVRVSAGVGGGTASGELCCSSNSAFEGPEGELFAKLLQGGRELSPAVLLAPTRAIRSVPCARSICSPRCSSPSSGG
ncbi:MAG: hypothetical protein K0S81_1078 [Rhodospirillales bacterium]|nr:hypothetical protein [Rhodospirillales bacterium]